MMYRVICGCTLESLRPGTGRVSVGAEYTNGDIAPLSSQVVACSPVDGHMTAHRMALVLGSAAVVARNDDGMIWRVIVVCDYRGADYMPGGMPGDLVEGGVNNE